MLRDVYSGRLKLNGEEDPSTFVAASNYAWSLNDLQRFEEAKTVLRKTMPVARRVHGDSHELTLKMRWTYAIALYKADGATLHHLREAVATLEDAEQTARRVFGGVHPLVRTIQGDLKRARETLRARETPTR